MDCWDVATLEVTPHQPVVLRSDDHGRAIAITLPAGELLQEHQTHEAAHLVVLGGRVEIVQPTGQAMSGGPGLFAHFQPAERREVRALEESRLLLLLTPWPGVGHHT